MVRLSHPDARRYLHRAADGDLPAEAQAQLQAHLDECAECRAYAEELRALETLLTHALRQRWEHRRPARDLGRPLAQPHRTGWVDRLLQATRPLMQVSSFMIVFAFIVAMMQAYYRPQIAPTQSPAPESAPATAPVTVSTNRLIPAGELVDDQLARYPDSVVEAQTQVNVPLPNPRRFGGAIPN